MKFRTMGVAIAAILASGLWGLGPLISAELGLMTERLTLGNQTVDLTRTADNFILLLDSAALSRAPDPKTGATQLETLKAALQIGIGQLPELSWRGGLVSYSPAGEDAGPLAQTEFADPAVKIKPFDRRAWLAQINTLGATAGRPGLLQHALLRLETILKRVSGKTMAFIVSDGAHGQVGVGDDPLAQARGVLRRHNVAFTLISTAEEDSEKQVLQAIAALEPKSRLIDFQRFVQHPIQISGALLVLTDELLMLNQSYPALAPIQIEDILFDFNRADLKPEFVSPLDRAGRFLRDHPQSGIILLGFTDNLGTSPYNHALSQARVESAQKYLEETYAVSPSRILGFGYGEASPIVDNDSEPCRRYNRRVVSLVVEMKPARADQGGQSQGLRRGDP